MTLHSDNVEIKPLVDIPVISNRRIGHYQGTGKSLGKLYTLVHEGPYETLGMSYNKLVEKVESDGKPGVSPSREIYHKCTGMLLKSNPKKYRIEIQIPVE